RRQAVRTMTNDHRDPPPSSPLGEMLATSHSALATIYCRFAIRYGIPATRCSGRREGGNLPYVGHRLGAGRGRTWWWSAGGGVGRGGGWGGRMGGRGAGRGGAGVGVIEKEGWGGECTFTACVRSKGLVQAARLAPRIRAAGSFGLRCGSLDVDFPAVMSRVRS